MRIKDVGEQKKKKKKGPEKSEMGNRCHRLERTEEGRKKENR